MTARHEARVAIREIYDSPLYLADSTLEKILDAVAGVYRPKLLDLIALAAKHSDLWTKEDHERFMKLSREVMG